MLNVSFLSHTCVIIIVIISYSYSEVKWLQRTSPLTHSAVGGYIEAMALLHTHKNCSLSVY